MGKVFLVKMLPNGTTEEFRYQLGNFKGLTYGINTPVSPMPIPEEDSSENVLIKIEGNSSSIDLRWVIKNQGVNLETVVPVASDTVPQQLRFFRNLFRPQSVDDNYQLILQFGASSDDDDMIFKGTYSNFKFVMADPNLLTFNGSCKFFEGNVALMFEVDVSSEPLNLVVTSPSSGRLDADWDVPSEAGESAITDYVVFYRVFNSGTDFTGVSVGSAATVLAPVATGLSNSVFEVFVRPVNAIGQGRASATKNITVLA